MASYKDIYESNSYASNQYAAGIWRGTGSAVVVPNVPGMEFTTQRNPMHFTSRAASNMHFTATSNPLHFSRGDD